MDEAILDSAEGAVGLTWGPAGFRSLAFLEGAAPTGLPPGVPAWVQTGALVLLAFLAGEGPCPTDLPVDLSGHTPFQRRLAEILRASAPGDRLSYGLLARLAGRPGAARAVGQAVARNPLLILVPCHRVVSASGEGGWSAFGSPERLRRLRERDRDPGDTGG